MSDVFGDFMIGQATKKDNQIRDLEKERDELRTRVEELEKENERLERERAELIDMAEDVLTRVMLANAICPARFTYVKKTLFGAEKALRPFIDNQPESQDS